METREKKIMMMLEELLINWKQPWGNVKDLFDIDETIRVEEYDKPEYLKGQLDMMVEKQAWICPIKLRGVESPDDSYYSISKDEIVLPEKERYDAWYGEDSFYGELLHNMAHSAGAESRLGRLVPVMFNSSAYAMEELVGELSAAVVCQLFGMEKMCKDDSMAYLKHWTTEWKDAKFRSEVMHKVQACVKMMMEIITNYELITNY